MLNVETEFLEDHQAKMVVTVEPTRVEKELKSAARRIAKKVNIPGFRKGKAPYHVIRQNFGEGALYEEALDPLGQAIYTEALEQSEFEPYTSGALDNVEIEPDLVMTFTVPLAPEIELGEYREIRVDFEPTEVTDEDVEHSIEHLREDQAIMEPVERAIEMGDVATLNIKGVFLNLDEEIVEEDDDDEEASTDEEESETEDASEDEADEEESGEGEDEENSEPQKRVLLDRKSGRVKVSEDATFPIVGFPEQVVGMEAGEEVRVFELTIPKDDEDYDEEVRGEAVRFEVSCDEVFSYELPELDDEFAVEVSDFETFEELKQDMRKRMEEAAERAARNQYADEILDEMIASDDIKLLYPPVMVEEQIDVGVRNMEARLGQQGISLDIYYMISEMDEEGLRESLREDSEKQLRYSLILGKLVVFEKLTVSAEEIEDNVQTKLLSFGAEAAEARLMFSNPRMQEMIINELMTEKAVLRLTQIAQGEAPDLVEDEEESEESVEDVTESKDDEGKEEAVAEVTEEEKNDEDAAEEEAEPDETE